MLAYIVDAILNSTNKVEYSLQKPTKLLVPMTCNNGPVILEFRWQPAVSFNIIQNQDQSYIIILILSVCVCLCVCVSVQPEISRMGGHIITLLTPSWRPSPGELHKLLFKPIRRAVGEKKPLEVFHQLHAEFHARTITFPVTLGRMYLMYYNKAFGPFSKATSWKTCRPHHWSSCPNCFSSLCDARFERKSLRKFSPVTCSTVTFRLPWAGWIWPTTRKPLEHFRRVCVEGHILHLTGTVVAIAIYVNGLQLLHSTRSWLVDKSPTRSWMG